LKRLRKFVEISGLGDHYAGVTVFEKETIIRRLIQWIDRDRDRADAHRAKESHRKRRCVIEEKQNTLFARDAERPQRAPHPANAVVKILIRDPFVAEMDCRLVAPAGCEIGVNQSRRIVLFRYHRSISTEHSHVETTLVVKTSND